MEQGIYEIGGRDRMNNTILCRDHATARGVAGEAVDATDEPCDDCG